MSKSARGVFHDPLETVEVNEGSGHAENALKARTESLAKHFVKQVKLVGANEEVKQGSEEVQPVVVSQLLNDPQVVHHLLHSHFVQGCHLQVRLIRVRLPNYFAANH